MFEKIKRWYEKGLWNRQMVQNAVVKKVITVEEAKIITKESLVEGSLRNRVITEENILNPKI